MLDNASCAICTLINHFFTGKFNMSLKPICVAIALTLTLTACGSSDNPSLTIPKVSTTTSNATGNSGSTTTNNSTSNSNSSTTTNSSTSNAGVTVDKTYAVSALKAEVDEQLRNAYGYAGFNSTNNYQITVGGKTYTSGNIDLKTLGNGIQRINATETASANVGGTTYTATRHSVVHLYQQPYSVVAGLEVRGGQISNGDKIGASDLDIDTVKGYTTKTLPSAGTYNYAGKAFSQKEAGQFNYAVNFDTRKGSGSITGIEEAGKITLNEGTISNLSHTNPDNTTISGFGIQSTATSEKMGNGEYKLGFFGPNAEEVAGTVNQNNNGLVGFGGTKQ